MKFTTQKLVAIGALAAIQAVITLGGAGLNLIAGHYIGGILNSLFYVAVPILGVLIIKKFGTATIMGLVFSVLVIPLPIFGPPGFLPKILEGVIGGLIIDLVFLISRTGFYRKITSILAGGFGLLANWLIGYFLLLTFNIPGTKETAKFFVSPYCIAGALVYGCVSGFIAYLIYKKLSNTSIVKRIQGE